MSRNNVCATACSSDCGMYSAARNLNVSANGSENENEIVISDSICAFAGYVSDYDCDCDDDSFVAGCVFD